MRWTRKVAQRGLYRTVKETVRSEAHGTAAAKDKVSSEMQRNLALKGNVNILRGRHEEGGLDAQGMSGKQKVEGGRVLRGKGETPLLKCRQT